MLARECSHVSRRAGQLTDGQRRRKPPPGRDRVSPWPIADKPNSPLPAADRKDGPVEMVGLRHCRPAAADHRPSELAGSRLQGPVHRRHLGPAGRPAADRRPDRRGNRLHRPDPPPPPPQDPPGIRQGQVGARRPALRAGLRPPDACGSLRSPPGSNRSGRSRGRARGRRPRGFPTRRRDRDRGLPGRVEAVTIRRRIPSGFWVG